MPAPTMASSEPLSRFAFFPNLPMELRLRIWTLSLPTPSTVRLTTSIKSGRLLFTDPQHQRKPSVLLYTCWESRCFYLDSHCKLVLDGNPKNPTISYLNPRLDVLHFDKKSFTYLLWVVSVLGDCELAGGEILHRIRRIETDVDTIYEITREQGLKDVIGPLLSQFSGLHEICFVLKKGVVYRRFRDLEGPSFFIDNEDVANAEVGKAALGLIENVFGDYRETCPDIRLPKLRVRVNLPVFLA